jgi:ferredoxin-NADP reductase
MDLCEVTLVDSEEVAEGTRAFRFAKPPGFRFVAGQFVNFTLIEPRESDDAGPLRSFSIASAPHDHDLMIATRMRPSAFKRTLAAMPVGAHIEMEGPFGQLALEDDDSPAILVAGGIGITPFRSMLREAAHRGCARGITLIYGNRAPQAAAFASELDLIARRLPGLRIVHCMSEPARAATPWQGESGFVTEALLARHVPDLARPTWYVAGPPAMTAATRDVLANLGVAASAIRVEDFAGY